MSNLMNYYQEEVLPKIKAEFNLTNNLAVPNIEKIVVNMAIADALTEKEVLEKVKEQLAAICGQRPLVTKARKSISSFKLKEGDQIGAKVTLRAKRAWDFLGLLIAVVLPRMRDFRGLATSKFDKNGNYSLGVTEQSVFPYLDYSKIDKIRGLVITIVIKNSNQQKSKRLLELLGIPFKES